jgi:hypothetical protein
MERKIIITEMRFGFNEKEAMNYQSAESSCGSKIVFDPPIIMLNGHMNDEDKMLISETHEFVQRMHKGLVRSDLQIWKDEIGMVTQRTIKER